MQLALKIEVHSLRAAREGLPRLISLLQRHQAQATFLFSFGPSRLSAPLQGNGQLRGAWRLRHHHLHTLGDWLQGRLWRAPRIHRQAEAALQAVADAGFECGIAAWDAAAWAGQARTATPAWTQQHIDRACSAFRVVFGHEASIHGAPNGQMNRSVWRQSQALGLACRSDVRGSQPFWPVVDGELIRCVQIPTTLPTLAELLDEGYVVDALAGRLLDQTAPPAAPLQVFQAEAGMAGGPLLPVLEALLTGWQAQGYRINNLSQCLAGLDLTRLPYHAVVWDATPGQAHARLLQGPAFP